MKDFILPKPIDNEIILDPSKVIMSKANSKGIILYANDYFMNICGYTEHELMGKPHNVFRHPDMPKIIFKVMWEQINKGKNIYAAVKNLAKDGSYYWVMTCFETTYDKNGAILAHYARRKAIPVNARKVIEDLYKTILAIEKNNVETAEKYFHGFVENSGMSYNDLFLSIIDMTEEEYLDYFKKEELNTNNINENILFDVDVDDIKKQEETVTIKESVEDLKEKIATLQNKLEKKDTKKRFFNRLFSKN